MTEQDDGQIEMWDRVFDHVAALLAQYGSEYFRGRGDYLLVEDNYGWRRVTFSVQNLKMISPEIVARLREFLVDLPDWEIVAAIDIPGTEKSWPRMGLTIRKHEIVDGLQRQYFPEEFRAYQYADSRPGTGYD
jgi:hypothetical protein